MSGVQVLGGGSLTLDYPTPLIGGRTCPYCGVRLALRGFAQQYGFCSPDHQRLYTAARFAEEEPPRWDRLLAPDLRKLQPKPGRLIQGGDGLESLPPSLYLHTPPVQLHPVAFNIAGLAPAAIEPSARVIKPEEPKLKRSTPPREPWVFPPFPSKAFGALVAAALLVGFSFPFWRAPRSKPATVSAAVRNEPAPVSAPVLVKPKTEPVQSKPAVDPPQPPPIRGVLPSGGWQQWRTKDLGRTIAAYEPSLSHADYRFGFIAQVEYGAFGWAFRTRDINDYYGMKLRIAGGKNTRLILEKFRRQGQKVISMPSVDLKFPASYGNVYRVQMEIKGQRYLTYINDELVDAWEDSTLKTGGVGFANETRERGKVTSWRYAAL